MVLRKKSKAFVNMTDGSAGCLGEVFVWNLGGDMRGVAIGEGRGGVVGCV